MEYPIGSSEHLSSPTMVSASPAIVPSVFVTARSLTTAKRKEQQEGTSELCFKELLQELPIEMRCRAVAEDLQEAAFVNPPLEGSNCIDIYSSGLKKMTKII